MKCVYTFQLLLISLFYFILYMVFLEFESSPKSMPFYLNERMICNTPAETSTERIKKLASSLLPAFLDSNTSRTVVVCNPTTVQELQEEYQEFGIQLNLIESLEDSFIAE